MDELNKPLSKPNKPASPAFGTMLMKVSVFAFIGSVLILGSWIILSDDPFGGEPVAVVSMQNNEAILDGKDVAVLELDTNPIDNDVRTGTAEIRGGQVDSLIELTVPETSFPTNDDIIIRPVGKDQFVIEPQLSYLPEDELIESSVYGDLPKRGADGSTPSDVYSRPLSAGGGFGTARVAIVVGGLGLSQTGTQSAIEELPGSVTLAFAPYGNSLQRWVQKARQEGHEIMIQVPLEPFDYPVNDPGPHTLQVNLSEAENKKRLHWVLARITNYVGVINFMGARFSANSAAMAGMLGELNRRGLLYVDDGSALRSEAATIANGMRMPFAESAILLDSDPDSERISAQLLKLEQKAREDGVALATASAFPASVKRIAQWVREAERKGIDVVPVSALTQVGKPTKLGQTTQ